MLAKAKKILTEYFLSISHSALVRFPVAKNEKRKTRFLGHAAPYSGSWTFRLYFFTAVYAGHPLISVQNFTEIVLGKPLVY